MSIGPEMVACGACMSEGMMLSVGGVDEHVGGINRCRRACVHPVGSFFGLGIDHFRLEDPLMAGVLISG